MAEFPVIDRATLERSKSELEARAPNRPRKSVETAQSVLTTLLESRIKAELNEEEADELIQAIRDRDRGTIEAQT